MHHPAGVHVRASPRLTPAPYEDGSHRGCPARSPTKPGLRWALGPRTRPLAKSPRTGRLCRASSRAPRTGSGRALRDHVQGPQGLPSSGRPPQLPGREHDRPDDGPDPAPDNPDIPAGYTFLGQFLDHDITLDTTPLDEQRRDPKALYTYRSPRYDLDSVYGGGPRRPSRALRPREPRQAAHRRRQRPARGPCPEPQRSGDHPRGAQRRKPGGRPDPPRLHEVLQPGRGPPGRRRRLPPGPAPGRVALAVDCPPRLPAPDRGPGDLGGDPRGARRWPGSRPSSVLQAQEPQQAHASPGARGRRVPLRAQHGAGPLLHERSPRNARRLDLRPGGGP